MDLNDIESILNAKCKHREQSILSDKLNIKHTITVGDIDGHLLYKFDGEGRNDLFPFFADSRSAPKGLRQMCDYFLFVQKENTLYAMLIELKDGEKAQGAPAQLRAGECFWNYLLSSAERMGLNIDNIKTVIVNYRPVKGSSNIQPIFDGWMVIYKFRTFAINNIIKCYNERK